MHEEEKIKSLCKRTGFDEITVGCFLSNFGVKNVCAGVSKNSCKDLEKCRVLLKIEMEK